MVLAGSATPGLSIKELIQISSDAQTTAKNLSLENVQLSLAPARGGAALRQQIAGLYEGGISADHVLAANGTTGANALAIQSLLQQGDHVIAMYPMYMQPLSILAATSGVEVSHWSLDPSNPSKPDLGALKSLIKPTTKMIIINNPNNPMGISLTREAQSEIVALARQHDIILLVDEIFRPLSHDSAASSPLSFLELQDSYDKVVVTGSLSKAWGLSGVRVGWIVTRDADIQTQCFRYWPYTVMALSAIDEMIAAEALSERCRPQITAKHLELANANLDLLESFVAKHQDLCSWTRPNAGATAFVRFRINGKFVDDVDFCVKLNREKGVLLAPGSKCFGLKGSDDFKGFVRMHITGSPDTMKKGLSAISEFLSGC